MVATNPKYRNRRELYYTDKFPDSQGIGTIIQVLKSVEGSFDHEYVPAIVPSLEGGTTAYTEIAGDAEPENNPEYQYPGYIYCDGSEYYIHDYPALFEAIGNDYGFDNVDPQLVKYFRTEYGKDWRSALTEHLYEKDRSNDKKAA